MEIAEQGQGVRCRAPFSGRESLVSDSETLGDSSEAGKRQRKSHDSPIKLAWPVFYPAPTGPPAHLDPALPDHIRGFIAQDLSLRRLERIRKFLWFVGNVGGRARSLIECLEHNLAIKITDRADMHVVTHFRTIYLKPLPEYLLCHEIWTDHICFDLKIYQDANTLLCSYTNILILSKSDLRIAHAHGLINKNITWEQWTTMAREVSRNRASRVVSIRWIHGELRLARLNWVYRLTRLKIYHEQDSRGWLIGTLVYITIVLTAMQVGLGTNKLQKSLAFQKASYGFTVFSIMAPVIILFSRWGLKILGAMKRRLTSKIAADRFEKSLRKNVSTANPYEPVRGSSAA